MQELSLGSAALSNATLFPQNWVFHGCGGCRAAIQVCRTTFHLCCMAIHALKVPETKPKPQLKPAPKPNAAANPGPKGQHRQELRMVFCLKKGFTLEPVEY